MDNYEVNVTRPDRMIVEAESASDAEQKALIGFGEGAKLIGHAELVPTSTPDSEG